MIFLWGGDTDTYCTKLYETEEELIWSTYIGTSSKLIPVQGYDAQWRIEPKNQNLYVRGIIGHLLKQILLNIQISFGDSKSNSK